MENSYYEVPIILLVSRLHPCQQCQPAVVQCHESGQVRGPDIAITPPLVPCTVLYCTVQCVPRYCHNTSPGPHMKAVWAHGRVGTPMRNKSTLHSTLLNVLAVIEGTLTLHLSNSNYLSYSLPHLSYCPSGLSVPTVPCLGCTPLNTVISADWLGLQLTNSSSHSAS